ncbi:ceramide kinase isoform X2 [Lycorma delicatula]|uniref:ceramide kinase isoform X2 n=1 Tax=Lycorma delicatula TaxID=130591 RepID=UPI003F50FC12
MTEACLDGDVWDTVLLSTFVIQKKKFKVLFNQGTLIWENEAPPYTRRTLPLHDIIAVSYNHNKSHSCCYREAPVVIDAGVSSSSSSNSNNCDTINDVSGSGSPVIQHLSFNVHYASKEKKNKWLYNVMSLSHSDPHLINRWVHTLSTFISGYSQRPKRLLAFVNPFGGKKRGIKIYNNIVKPLFDIAGVEINLTITQRANHARDVLLTESLDNYDGVVCVGGDGTFSEVMNGLIIRTARDQDIDVNDPNSELPKPKLRVGVIPGGSTDTIAYCIHGTTDIKTAVIHIIIGNSTGLDVSSVHSQTSLLCFYASVISYGYLGDIIRDSDNFRWMGPKRYDFSGFKRFIANHGYEGELVFAAEPSNVSDDSKCFKDCLRCQSFKDLTRDDYDVREWKRIRGKFLMVNGANLSCACPRSPNGISPHCHLGDGCLDLVLVKHTSLLNNFRLLLTLSNKMKTVYDLPFVEVHRTRQFTFQALPIPAERSSDFSVWNCDGEMLSDTCIHIRAHCQLLQVFFRGIEACLEEERTCSCF